MVATCTVTAASRGWENATDETEYQQQKLKVISEILSFHKELYLM
jgi:hypothetical protein